MSNPNRDPKTQQFRKRSGSFKALILILVIAAGIMFYPQIKEQVRRINFVNHYEAKPLPVVETKSPEQIKASDIEKRTQEVKKRPEHIQKVEKFSETEALRVATAEYEKAAQEKYDAEKKKIDDELSAAKTEVKKNQDIVKKNEVSF